MVGHLAAMSHGHRWYSVLWALLLETLDGSGLGLALISTPPFKAALDLWPPTAHKASWARDHWVSLTRPCRNLVLFPHERAVSQWQCYFAYVDHVTGKDISISVSYPCLYLIPGCCRTSRSQMEQSWHRCSHPPLQLYTMAYVKPCFHHVSVYLAGMPHFRFAFHDSSSRLAIYRPWRHIIYWHFCLSPSQPSSRSKYHHFTSIHRTLWRCTVLNIAYAIPSGVRHFIVTIQPACKHRTGISYSILFGRWDRGSGIRLMKLHLVG